MKIIICLLLVASTVFGLVNLSAPKIKSSDFKPLSGEQWKGKLTYQDYRSNKKVSILSNLTVTESNEEKLSWIFEYEYPDEPKANKKSIVKISKDGKTFDEEMVVEKMNLPNETLKIVTTKNGMDAIEQSGVKRVVNLSTIGGNLEKGSGILLGAHDVEEILNKLPPDVATTHMRPTSFFYNLYSYVEMIKKEGFIAANYGAEDIVPWVSPTDIAAAIAEEIVTPLVGRKVRYVASDERSGNDTASVLGAAIGKPDLKWILITDEQTLGGLEAIGMNPKIATGLVEMYAGFHSGLLAEDYYRNRPEVLGKVKLEDFAKEFAAAFQKA